MVDSRKFFIAFAALALLVAFGSTASAQLINPNQGFTCVANAGAPVIDRAEGITELVGDLLLQCTGGSPTPAGQAIPQSNITVTLNTNVTSRLIGGGFIDSLLLIDEPYPSANQNPPTTQVPVPAGSPKQQTICRSNTGGTLSSPTNCNIVLGTGGVTSPYANAANVYVAQLAAVNQVTFLGVPIDAPGTNGVRIIRITNVRANACQLGLSSTLVPTQIVAFISVNGSQQFTINNPQQTVAFIQQGLVAGGTTTNLLQCNNNNVILLGIGSTPAVSNFSVTFKEGFAASFKRRVVSSLTTTFIGPNGPNNGDGVQNVPGFPYNTESGLQPQPAAGLDSANFGLADFGTRILLRFANINTGSSIFVPVTVPLLVGSNPGAPNPPSGGGAPTGGFLRLVGNSDANGNVGGTGGFATGTTTFNPGGSAVQVTAVGNTGAVVYEVVNADPFAVEQATVPVAVAFVSNTGSNLPAPGQSTVQVSFAPLSTVNVASATAPIPRFCDNATARNTFAINQCACNLLFPFVTNQAGFDTGIALANTSLDPFGTATQAGTVSLFYFGNTVGGGAAPPTQTTSAVVPAGQELVFTLSNGGNFGIAATPGFQGYIISTARFQFCHAFAFISDVGAQKFAEGYLAIQLDVPGLNRTGILGENEGH
jgi:hypothetical protein